MVLAYQTVEEPCETPSWKADYPSASGSLEYCVGEDHGIQAPGERADRRNVFVLVRLIGERMHLKWNSVQKNLILVLLVF